MAAVVAIINYEGKILVGKKRTDSKKFIAGKWHIPGGHINKGESDEVALKREMKEETGLEITVGKYIGNSVTPASGSEARWYECFTKTNYIVAGSDLFEAVWIEKENISYLIDYKIRKFWSDEINNYFLNT